MSYSFKRAKLERSMGDLRIEMIATGNELLDGSIADKHTQSLAARLREFGLHIRRSVQLPDHRTVLIDYLREAADRSNMVVVTGGLGPTTDDLTLEVAAEAFDSALIEDPMARKNVLSRLRQSRSQLNEGNKKQMFIPKGAKALMNNKGTAPIVYWPVAGAEFFFVPGVPREFDFALEEYLMPYVKKRAGHRPAEHLFIYKVFGWRESELNELMKSLKLPKEVEVGFRTHLPENHIKLRVRAQSRAAAKKKISTLEKRIKRALGRSLFTEVDETFEQVFVREFTRRRKKIAIAESCTGGLASSMVTRIAGSSKVLERSFVVYSNEAKQDMLGVRAGSLKKFGAVSEQVAEEMAEGALSNSNADFAVSITGVAGPGGGTKKKPVGTVWLAAKSAHKSVTKKLELPFDRELNQKASAYYALQMLREL